MYTADIESIVDGGGPAFALLYRPRSGCRGRIELLVGDPGRVDRIADLPLRPLAGGTDCPELIAVLPYRQLVERGIACVDDGTPLPTIRVRARSTVPHDEALRLLPDDEAVLGPGEFDLSDDAYGAVVRRIVSDEIGHGAGSNFVIRRSFRTVVANPSRRLALAIFRRLLATERGAYWVFVVHWDGRTLVGASPECHLRLAGGVATMNPISGTYRYPGGGPTTEGLLEFLADRKETEELLMVVDEELKMMAQLCREGGRVLGPRLRSMSRLAHTEYVISGRTRLDARTLLRETMFAPTVTGSPLASACRVISAYEGTGRGYYGGVLALLGQANGQRTLDSTILIRTADLSPDGRMEIGVGATLVRTSDAVAEVAETRAKAAALVAALGAAPGPSGSASRAWQSDRRVRRALAARNEGLSVFWRGAETSRALPSRSLAGRRVLVVDAEDSFTAMLATQVRTLGPVVDVQRVGEPWRSGYDAVIVGPGPGDPRDGTDTRIARLRELTGTLLAARMPLLAVCLGHQTLAGVLGLPLVRLAVPTQGTQRRIVLFGQSERVGFYNTFVARSDTDALVCPITGDPVDVLRDPATNDVYALSKPGVRSVQFHVESFLTEHGPEILLRLLTSVMAPAESNRS